MPVLQCFIPGKKDAKFIESDLKKKPEKGKDKDEDKEKKEKDEAAKKVEDKSKVVDYFKFGESVSYDLVCHHDCFF